MTPDERRQVDELFEKLAALESNPREPDAEQAIMAGLRKAPHATYALVQTVLLQDEALHRVDERIRELESAGAQAQQQGGGFLDSMRDTFFGGGDRPRGAVPPVGGAGRPMGVPPGYRSDNPYAAGNAGVPPQQQAEPQRGGSFLGTAAAAAAGMIGGSLLMNSLGGMFGGQKTGTAQSAADLGGGKDSNPWSGDASGGDLAKQAGADHVGQQGSGERAGLYDQQSNQDHAAAEDGYDTADYDGGDDGFDMGDSDFA